MTDSTPAIAAVRLPGDIVARVDFQYLWRTWALFLLLFIFGILCVKDGFFTWPHDNAVWAKLGKDLDRPIKPPHEASGVLFNQVFGVLLPLISIPVLVWRSYNSRGEYRLSGNTLRVPGHPPITFDQICGLDLVQWDRKGIAAVEYEIPGSPKRTLLLRDMIYQRLPTDKIVKRIETHLEAQDAAARPAEEKHD